MGHQGHIRESGKTMDKRNSDLVLRLSIAIAFGLLIASSTYLLAFYRQRLAFGFAQNPDVVGSILASDIEKYRAVKGHPPARLSEVNRGAADPWDRPYFYEVQGDSYKL